VKLMDILQEVAKNLRHGKAAKVAELVQMALDDGLSWEVILNKGLFAGMEVVGRLFREEDIFIPEVLMAAKAMDAGQKVLEPLLLDASGGRKMGKVVLGTVKGDVHNLGKNLVGVMLRGAGFEVIDIGEDVPAEKFVEFALSEKAQLVGMSALLTVTMPYMRTTIEAMQRARLKQVKTIIGGACVTQEYADEIGADGYAENAGAAVAKTKELLALK
jgi:5-methyltetrahydrofolate--homocysteine methyltransferase